MRDVMNLLLARATGPLLQRDGPAHPLACGAGIESFASVKHGLEENLALAVAVGALGVAAVWGNVHTASLGLAEIPRVKEIAMESSAAVGFGGSVIAGVCSVGAGHFAPRAWT